MGSTLYPMPGRRPAEEDASAAAGPINRESRSAASWASNQAGYEPIRTPTSTGPASGRAPSGE
jgi:hypothetical protein